MWERADQLFEIRAALSELVPDIVCHRQRARFSADADVCEWRPAIDQHHVRIVRRPQFGEHHPAVVSRVVAAAAAPTSVPLVFGRGNIEKFAEWLLGGCSDFATLRA